MSQIEAIYRNGVFEPLEPVDLKDEQRVRLSIEVADKGAIEAWFKCAAALREEILERRRGEPVPDSTLGIAEDRMR
ncbi:MAG: antitoxin family protein [Planctomycetes bacterium]|jgi:predicted DNA-binding antitoxin AbrB/MazE fold protein|nr:antitoxin family protein [Planctomycetota bacterium]